MHIELMRKKQNADRCLTSRTIGKEIAVFLIQDTLKQLEFQACIPTIKQHKAVLADEALCRRTIAKTGIFNSYAPTVKFLVDIG